MATITNIICTNNKEIDIQSNGGAIKIGTTSNATTITIGNSSTVNFAGSFSLNSGIGQVNLSGNVTTKPGDATTPSSFWGAALASGVSTQNTTQADCILNICVQSNNASAATISAGVGPSTGPATSPIISSWTRTTSTNSYLTFCLYVPKNYWVLFSVTSGTATITGTPVCMAGFI